MRPVVWMLLALSPVLLATAYFLAGDVRVLTDPCHTWGETSGTLRPDDVCTRRSASSQTLEEYLLMTLVFKGTVLAGAALAVVGAHRRQASLALPGIVLLMAISPPLMLGFAGGILLASASLGMVVVALLPGFDGWTRRVARVVAAAVAAFLVVQAGGALVSGIVPFISWSLVQLFPAALMVWAVFWMRA